MLVQNGWMRLRIVVMAGVLLLVGLVGRFGMAQAPRAGAADSERRSTQSEYRLSPEREKLAVTLAHKRIALDLLATVWGIAQLWLLLSLGVAARMRDLSARVSRWRWVHGVVFVSGLLLVMTLLDLPLSMVGHHISVEYGQSVQHWPGWMEDKGKGFGLTLVVGVPLALGLFYCIRRSPRRWWLWIWVPSVVIAVFGVFVAPVLVDPLFDKFTPLVQSDPALVQRLEQVVQRGGISIPPDRMFLMQASAKFTGLNAYVTGLGSSKRVVVWDTTVAKASPDDISFIFGHEMGHYVLNHIYLGLAFTALLLLVCYWVGYHGLQWLLMRNSGRWRVSGQEDWAALVVILLVVSVLSFSIEPVANGFSRWEEHAADVYGQEAIHGIVPHPRETAVRSFQELGDQSLDEPDPNPLLEFWMYSHPSISHRVAFAASYNPWEAGRHPRYFRK